MSPLDEHARRGIVLFEDGDAESLGPVALLRPVFDLIAGGLTLRERVVQVSGQPVRAAQVRPHLRALLPELGLASPGVGEDSGERLFLNAACLLDRDGWEEVSALPSGAVLATAEGRQIAARLDPESWQSVGGGSKDPTSSHPGHPIRVAKAARILRHSPELITVHEALLDADIRELQRALRARPVAPAASEGIFVRGDEVFAEEGVRLQGPLAVDATAGPILLRRGSRLAPFTLLEGPVLVGEGTQVLGGRIAQSYLGPGCLVRGEVAGSVLLGWSNKAHDGFLGHSYLGAWVNLGAMTTTSNLKNTYGEVRVPVGETLAPSGRTKLGSVIGDHTKTAIGTLLATGSTIGVGVNLFGAAGLAPRWVPSFVWGVGATAGEHDLARCLQTAERVTARRGIALSDPQRAALRGAFAVSAAERWRFLEHSRV
jgi:UDP-N-acetylglucosamine diphosphorylase/glucosamine-1-phosphate N-acetyltransferase